MKFKDIFFGVTGVVGSVIVSLFGGWAFCLTVLLICNILDFGSGLLTALVFHKSKKTETGAASSAVCYQGIAKKVMIWVIVLVMSLIDRLLGIDYLRNATAMAYIACECLSILENAILMGLPVPKIVQTALGFLDKKVNELEGQFEKIAPTNNDKEE